MEFSRWHHNLYTCEKRESWTCFNALLIRWRTTCMDFWRRTETLWVRTCLMCWNGLKACLFRTYSQLCSEIRDPSQLPGNTTTEVMFLPWFASWFICLSVMVTQDSRGSNGYCAWQSQVETFSNSLISSFLTMEKRKKIVTQEIMDEFLYEIFVSVSVWLGNNCWLWGLCVPLRHNRIIEISWKIGSKTIMYVFLIIVGYLI